jgi:hypothetical protein
LSLCLLEKNKWFRKTFKKIWAELFVGFWLEFSHPRFVRMSSEFLKLTKLEMLTVNQAIKQLLVICLKVSASAKKKEENNGKVFSHCYMPIKFLPF